MDLNDELCYGVTAKEWIDNATYGVLLSKWRFATIGEPILQGEAGEYYAKVMAEKRDADPGGAVQASKSLGWG